MSPKILQEHPYLKIVKLLPQLGFIPASNQGLPFCYTEYCIGILAPRKDKRTKFLWLFQKSEKQRALFIGILKLNSLSEKHWFLDVYGREWMEKMKEAAILLEDKMGMNVSIELKLERPKFAINFSDIVKDDN